MKPKYTTPTARHSLSESSTEQNNSTFSALGAFRPAYLNAKKVMGVPSGNGRSISDENDNNRKMSELRRINGNPAQQKNR